MRNKYYSISLRISLVSILVNLSLSLLKLILGFISNSISIITDAFHSFSDLITTVAVIFSLRLSTKPPDKKHPFGHGRIEDIGGLFVCFVLAIVGFNFFQESLHRLISPKELRITNEVIILIFVTAIVKLILGLFTTVFAKRINSSILSTDAFHHYSDFFTSLVISIGLVFVQRGLFYFDALLGILVSLLIIFWAGKSAKEFIDNLIGKEVPLDTYQKIREIVFTFSKVESVHGINIHSYGRRRIISLHIVVQRDLSLDEAHSIADSIEKKIYKKGLGKCVVHVDLKKELIRKETSYIERCIRRLIRFTSNLRDFHAVEIISTEDKDILNFHLILDKNTSLEESHKISHKVASFLKKKFSFSQVNIHVEPYKEVEKID